MGDVVKVTPFAFASPWSISWYPFWEGRPENPYELCCVSIRAGSICSMQSSVWKFSLCSNRLYLYDDCGQESKSMLSGQSHKRPVTTTSVNSCLCWFFYAAHWLATRKTGRRVPSLLLVVLSIPHSGSLDRPVSRMSVSLLIKLSLFVRMISVLSIICLPVKRFLWGQTTGPLIPTNMCMSWKVNPVKSLQFWGLHVW